jgi:hypothetical protein
MAKTTTPQTIVQGRRDQQAPRFRDGQVAFPGREPNIRGYRNLADGKAQIQTLTIDTFTADAVYAYQVDLPDGTILTFSYTEDGDTNVAGVAAKVALQLNTHPNVRTFGDVVASGADAVLTGNARSVGTTARLSSSDDKISVVETQATVLDSGVPFARAIMRAGSQKGELIGSVASPMDTAQSLVLTHGASAEAQVVLKVDGARIVAKGATATALQSSLNGVLPATGFTVSRSTNDVTITVDTAGDQFELVSVTGDAVIKSQVDGDSMAEKFAGITAYHDLSTSTIGTEPGRKMDVLEEDAIVLKVSGAASDGPLYIGTDLAERSQVFAARATGRVYIGSRLKVDEVDGDFIIAKIR